MKTHRYTQIIVPLDRFVNRLAPQSRLFVGLLEGSLVVFLLTSVVLYSV